MSNNRSERCARLVAAIEAALAAAGAYGNRYGDADEFAVRFDARDLEPGDTLDASRHNIDRDDERDFPDHDSADYNDLPILNGTSAYSLTTLPRHLIDCDEPIYLIAGDVQSGGVVVEHEVAPYVTIEHKDTLDYGEVTVADAVVVARIDY